MHIKLFPSVPFNQGMQLKHFYGYANGSFTLVTSKDKQNYLRLYTPLGIPLPQTFKAKEGVALSDGSYILKSQGKPGTHNYDGKNRILRGIINDYTLYTDNGNIRLTGFDEFQLFNNGWYMVRFNDYKQLYDENHNLVAEKFSDCKVFAQGYAICLEKGHYPHKNWQIFDFNHKIVRIAHLVISFLGNGCALEKFGSKNEYRLISFEGILISEDIFVKFKEFSNQNFTLTDNTDHTAMYNKDGICISVKTTSAQFLPDGSFIQYTNKLITGHYSKRGFLIPGNIYQYDIASSYYVLISEGKNELFNDAGKKIGQNYDILASSKELALFKKDNVMYLYNTKGKLYEQLLS